MIASWISFALQRPGEVLMGADAGDVAIRKLTPQLPFGEIAVVFVVVDEEDLK